MEEQAKKERKKGSGGKREGAGKKINVSGEKKKNHGIALRPDILKTLKKIKNYTSYIENAVLKKFEEDGIELVK